MPVAGLEQPLPDPKLNPVGRVSRTTTLVAVDEPLLTMPTVKTTSVLGLTLAADDDSVRARSVVGRRHWATLAESMRLPSAFVKLPPAIRGAVPLCMARALGLPLVRPPSSALQLAPFQRATPLAGTAGLPTVLKTPPA